MSKELLELLNRAIARELAVSVQYMWHHVMAVGIKSPEIKDLLKEIAIEEMKHAEKVAERLQYLGGTPTTKPTEIRVGGTLEEMVRDNLEAEREALVLYKRIIRVAEEGGDPTTRRLFEEILAEEEDHENLFSRLLEA
ncbi:MAG: ferritin-like domain-containing protein [Candidatus Hydrothermarchaeota archaeon]